MCFSLSGSSLNSAPNSRDLHVRRTGNTSLVAQRCLKCIVGGWGGLLGSRSLPLWGSEGPKWGSCEQLVWHIGMKGWKEEFSESLRNKRIYSSKSYVKYQITIQGLLLLFINMFLLVCICYRYPQCSSAAAAKRQMEKKVTVIYKHSCDIGALTV